MTATPWGFRDILPEEAQAREEIAHWKEYKYMVVNDDLAEAYDHMRAIILAERHRNDNRREDYHG